jgi:hypothetical protein
MQAMKEFIYTYSTAVRTNRPKSSSKLGTFLYWQRCVQRLNVLADTNIGSGVSLDGVIDPFTRSQVRKVFNHFLEGYKGKVGDDRPFNRVQEDEFNRCLNGGIVL